MVDSEATHNFVATREATKLGLKLEDDTSRIKAINTKAQKIHNIAKDVLVQVGEWKGTCSLLCILLEDFDMILGINLFLKAKVALIPLLGGLMVLEESQPCFVHALKEKTSANVQPKMLYTIQLKKGLKWGQDAYVANWIKIKEGQSMEVLDAMVGILKEFKDVMSTKLPKKLPPQQPIDHKIELLLGTKPFAQVPMECPLLNCWS